VGWPTHGTASEAAPGVLPVPGESGPTRKAAQARRRETPRCGSQASHQAGSHKFTLAGTTM